MPEQASTNAVAMIAGLLVFLLAAAPFIPKAWRAYRRYRILKNPQQAPRTAASFWYARMLKLMERKGIRKSPAQTPGEFASAISDSQVHEEVVVFTEHYERARFDGSPEDAMRLPALYQELAGRK